MQLEHPTAASELEHPTAANIDVNVVGQKDPVCKILA